MTAYPAFPQWLSQSLQKHPVTKKLDYPAPNGKPGEVAARKIVD